MALLNIYRAGVIVTTVSIDEKTVLQTKLMNEDIVVSEFVSDAVLPVAIGDYITFGGKQYFMNNLPTIVKKDNSTFKYNVNFQSQLYDLNQKMLISSDGLMDFSYAADPLGALTLIVSNMNANFSGWTVGDVDAGDVQVMEFYNESCRQALGKIAEVFGFEFEVVGKTINFKRAIGTVKPYTFQYGKNNGLYGIERRQVENKNVFTRVYGFGGTKNIPFTYRNRAKRLVFEERFLEKNVGIYGIKEGQFTDENIFPKRTADLTAVNTQFTETGAFNVTDSYVEDSTLNFDINDYLLEGLIAKIVFKSGALSGYQFDIWKYDHATKRIYFNPFSESDGYVLPSAMSKPEVGDSYTLVDIKMPGIYIIEAEQALKAATQRFIDENAVPKVVYVVNIDPKYAKANLIDIQAGDLVKVVDVQLGISRSIRIASLSYPICNPYKMTAIIADYIPFSLQQLTQKTQDRQQAQLRTVVNNISKTTNNDYSYRGTQTINNYGSEYPEEAVVIINGRKFNFTKAAYNTFNPMILESGDIISDQFWDNDTYVTEWRFKGGDIEDRSRYFEVETIDTSTPTMLTALNKLKVKLLTETAEPEYLATVGADGVFGRMLYQEQALSSEWETMGGDQSTVKLSGFTDDIGATEPIIANEIFIDTINGNDSTAAIENRGRPYKTFAAAKNAIIGSDLWVLHFLNASSTITINESLPERFSLFSNGTNKFIFGPNTHNNTLKNFDIIAPDSEIEFSGGERHYNVASFAPVHIDVKKFNLISSADPRGNAEAMIRSNLYSSVTIGELVLSSMYPFSFGADFNIGLLTINTGGGILIGRMGSRPMIAKSVIEIGTINSLSTSWGGAKIFGVDDGPKSVTIKEIIGTLPIVIFTFQRNNTLINFNDTYLDPNVNLSISGGIRGGTITVKGSINTNSTVTLMSGQASGAYTPGRGYILDGFTAKINPLHDLIQYEITIRNSNLTVVNHLVQKRVPASDGMIRSFIFQGYNTVYSENSNQEEMFIELGARQSIIVQGAVTTNIKSFGRDVDAIFRTIGFKEKLSEIIIRSKLDIINKVLDVGINYVIDGHITLGSGEFIIVPANGNLTINGYGLELSTIEKNAAGESIFTSPIGGSGGLQMSAIKFIMGSPTTSCFNLTDETTFNAVECVKVNFEGSGNIGVLNNYRQGLWSNIGLFGLSDGLTFSSPWRGGFVTNQVIARNLRGTTGFIFKAGAGLTFASRVSCDGNIDIPAGWGIADFADANFINDNTFQMKNAIISRAGVFDDTDALFFPNINEESAASEWSGNKGIKNSSVSYAKLKSPDGTVYNLSVDNSGTVVVTPA